MSTAVPQSVESVSPGGRRARIVSASAAAAGRHPIVAYLLVSFMLGWAILIPALRLGVNLELVLPAIVVFTQFGPALLLTWLIDGRDGAARFVRSVVRWRVPAWWYLAAAFALPMATLALSSVLGGTGPLHRIAERPALLWPFLLLLALQPLENTLEESGWMGFVQARLQRSRGPILAAVLTAPVFTLIHAPVLVSEMGLLPALVPLAVLIAFAVPFRIMLGWFFNGSGSSLLIVGIFHGAYNATNRSGLLPASGGLPAFVLTTAVMLLAAVIVIWLTRGRLGRRAGGDWTTENPA